MATYFLSHSSNHKTFCESLRDELQRLGHQVWLDEFDLHCGTNIPSAITDGIYDADHFILLMTPEITNSPWVNWEINVATAREINEQIPNFIVPIMHRAVPTPRLIGHKLYLPTNTNPLQLANEILGGTRLQPTNACGFHTLTYDVTLGTQFQCSLRNFSQALTVSACTNMNHYSYFPLFTRQSLQSTQNNRHLISQTQQPAGNGVEGRDSVIELHESGQIKIYDTCTDTMGTSAIIWVRRIVTKTARLVKVLNQTYRSLGFTGDFTIDISLSRLETPFYLEALTPQECEPAHRLAIGGPKTIGRNTALHSRSTFNIQPGDLMVPALSAQLYELHADLFFPIRLNQVGGGGNLPLKMSLEAVTRATDLIVTTEMME